MSRISSRPILAMLIVIIILPAASSAQSLALGRGNGNTHLLELFKPIPRWGVYNNVSYPVDYSLETFALFLSLRRPIGSKHLVVELPFAHAAFDTKIDRPFSYYRHRGASSMVGNPYLGLELRSLAAPNSPEPGINPPSKSRRRPFFARLFSRVYPEVGIRLPLAQTKNNYAARVGELADFDRYEAFEKRFIAAKVMINYRSQRATGWIFHARTGAMILRNIDDPGDNNPDLELLAFRDWHLALLLNAQLGYQIACMSFGLNLSQGFIAGVKLGNLRLEANCRPIFSERSEGGLFGLRLGI